MTCIRTGLATARMCDILNDRISKILGLKTGIFIAIETGQQCTISGCGPMYEEYLKTGKITKHSGFGDEPKSFYNHDFDSAPFQFLKFDETYADMPYDSSKSKFYNIFKSNYDIHSKNICVSRITFFNIMSF